MKYMVIDYHKQYFVAKTMNNKGKVLSKDKFSTDRESYWKIFQKENFKSKSNKNYYGTVTGW